MQSFAATTTITLKSLLDLIQIGDENLYGFRKTTLIESVGREGSFTDFVHTPVGWHGFVTKKELKNLRNGKPFVRSDLRLALPGFITEYAEHGWSGKNSDYALHNLFAEDVFQAISDDPTAINRIVRLDNGNNMVFDRHGIPLPYPMFASYLSGNFRDGAYDIEKAAAHLKARENVKNVVVSDVPYYNSDDGCRRQIQFTWFPTQEEMIEICVKSKSLNKNYPLTSLWKAAFELDSLGLRAAGTTRNDTYYGVR